MKLIQAPVGDLLKTLQVVTGIVEHKHTLPILSNVLIERRLGNLDLTATDLEIQVLTRSTCALEGEDIAVTASARKLQDILRKLPAEADVSIDFDDSLLHVKAGRSKFKLQTLPADDFPLFPEDTEVGACFSVEQRELRHAFSLVQCAMAKKDIRYYLNGLLMVIKDDTVTLVATDGHRLALATLATASCGSRKEIIVPRKAVVELVSLLSETEAPMQIEVLGNQVRFTLGETVLVSKTIDGKFPDYKRVIPAGHTKQFQIDRQVLLQALQRAAILSNEKFRGVRWILSANTLCIACTNSEQEEAQEELEIDYQGDTLDIGFNVTYLTDVLPNTDSDEVVFLMDKTTAPALMKIAGEDDFLYVIMPMRI